MCTKISYNGEPENFSSINFPYLNISADMTVIDEGQFEDEETLFVYGSIDPHKFLPDTENENEYETDDNGSYYQNTNW